jgi:hypothetical protein
MCTRAAIRLIVSKCVVLVQKFEDLGLERFEGK